MFDITIDWNLAWTIAWGILLASGISGVSTLLYNMWADNYKATILIVLMFLIPSGIGLGIYFQFLGWIWLIPGLIGSYLCFHFTNNVLNKEDESE